MSRSLCLFAICACAGARAEPAPIKTPHSKPTAPSLRRVHLSMPPEGPDVSTLVGASATREPLPRVGVMGWIGSTNHPSATLEKPPLALGDDHGEIIYATEYPDGKLVTDVHTLAGDRYEIPLTIRQSTHWYDLAPGVLAVTHTPTKVLVSRYDRGSATPSWKAELPGVSIDSALVVGWFEDGAPIVSVHGSKSTELSVLDSATGTVRRIAMMEPGLVVPAVTAKTFAVILDTLLPDCQPCSRLEVRSLADGREVSHTVIPESPIAFRPPAGGAQTIGFDGKQLWRYAYVPAHHSDVLGRGFEKDCSYDVFDVSTGKKARSLDAADGEWKALAAGCQVRALLPLVDGGALAVAVVGAHAVDVVRFRSAP